MIDRSYGPFRPSRFPHRGERIMLLLPSKYAALLASRRTFLSGGGQAVLSATAVALIAGCAAKADTTPTQTAEMSKSDVDILNTALALEYEGIAAYQVG